MFLSDKIQSQIREGSFVYIRGYGSIYSKEYDQHEHYVLLKKLAKSSRITRITKVISLTSPVGAISKNVVIGEKRLQHRHIHNLSSGAVKLCDFKEGIVEYIFKHNGYIKKTGVFNVHPGEHYYYTLDPLV